MSFPLPAALESHPELSAKRSIVFFEADVDNYQALLAGLPPNIEVHILDAGQDGLALMAQVLAERSDIDSLHIVSHGSEGAVSLGSLALTTDALPTRGDDLATIRAALAPDADILLYGCNVGAGTNGAAFVAALAKATGADVAASSDLTGAAELGGDWMLEQTSGTIDSYNPFLLSALGSYVGLLATTGTDDGTYDFGAPITPDTDGDGFIKYGDKFFISNGIVSNDPTSIYYEELENASASIVIRAEGGSVAKTFTFQDLTLSILDWDGTEIPLWALDAMSIITRGTDGRVINTHTGHYVPATTAQFSASSFMNGNVPFNDTGVASITISWTIDYHPVYSYATEAAAATLNFHSIRIADVSAGVVNTAPTFVGTDTTLAISQNAAAIDLKSLLHASDADSGQTLTWSQSSAPIHGTLSINSATHASGSSSIAPGGTVTYTPATGFTGTDTFTVQVSDGTATATRTITVNVSPGEPGVPDLAAGSDTGTSVFDDVTKAGILSFSGASADGDSSSTVRVFLDRNENGVFDDGIDPSGTAIVNNGSWIVDGIDVSAISDGEYKVYAQITSAGGSLTSTRSDALDVTLDRTAPTLAITSSTPTLKAGETATITFTFSEDPGSTFTWDGTIGDVVVSGGTLSAISGEGLIRTATFTPDSNLDNGSASITVAGGSYADAAGNIGGAGASPSLTFDTLAPAVASIVRADSEVSNATSVAYTVTFDQSVSGVDANDFVLTSTGSVDSTVSSVSGSGDTYTVTVSSISGDGTLRLDLKNAGTGITDSAGNTAAGYTGGQTYTFDHTAPAVSSVAVPAAATYRVGQDLDFTVHFNEAVTVDTTNGTPSIALTLDTGGTVQAAYVSGSGGAGLTFRYTVVAGNADANGVALASGITLNGGTIKDAVGNDSALALNSVGSTSGVLVAALAPTVIGIERIGDELTNGPSVEYTVTFSDSVSGVDASDFTLVGNGAMGTIVSVDGSGDTYTVTVETVSGEGTLRLDLNSNGTGIVSEYGSAIEGGYTGGQSYSVDTVRPVLAEPITISDTALKIGDSATVTFVFTEAVTDFTVDDVTVPNGTLTDLNSDDGITWTATLTPSNGSTGLTNVLTLNYSGIVDRAGNAGIGTADSLVYEVDTVRPSLASGITISNTDLTAGGAAVVTFTFAEAVTGFDIGDVTVPNGTLSDLTPDEDGRVWTATLTPDEETRDASNVLTLDYSGITDLAGNPGSGTSASFNYAVDTILPKLAQPITLTDTALKIGDTAEVTFVFTEAVYGFTKEDVTVSNGTLSELDSQDGITWTATLTPAEGASALANVLSLDYSGIATLSGNVGSGTAESDNYTVDTVAPTTDVALNITSLKAGATAEVTFTFSKQPQDFTLEDVTAQGGELSDLSELVENDDGTWSATAIFTPAENQQAESNVITVNTSWTDVAGNAPEAPAVSDNYVVDTVPPEAPTITSAELSNVATPVIAGNAEPGASVIVTVGGATYTVQAGDQGWTLDLGAAEATSGELSLNVNGENPVSAIARDAAGNESEAGTQTLVIDSTAPTVTVTLDADSLKAGDTATVLFTFSEQPLNFSLEDVTAQGGQLSDLSELIEHDNGTWSATATFTPLSGVEAATNVISVGVDWADAAGNAPLNMVESDSFAIDTLPPSAPAFTSDELSNDTSPVLTGTAEQGAWIDVTVGGATYAVQADEDGWSLDLGSAVPSSGSLALDVNGENLVSVMARDALGNKSEAATQTLVIDSTAPSVEVTLDTASLKAGDQALVTFTFTEQPRDFSLNVVTAEGGDLSDFSGPVEINGVWSATAIFTPSADLEDAENVITVGTGWTDVAGNAPEAPEVSDNYVVDTVAPAAPVIAPIALSNNTMPVLTGEAESGSWVIVTVGGATYAVQADADGWALDLKTAVLESGDLSLDVNGENPVSAIARDALGNESEAGTQTIIIDTAPPSVLIAMSDTNLTLRETATVTFTFSEVPHGFTLDAVTAQGGQLSGLSDLVENDDGTWRATAVFTPTPNLSDRTNVITVSTEWTDAAGNAPLEAADSDNYVINTYPPAPVTPPVTPPVIPPVDQWEGLPDNDGDGIPESVENLVPGMTGGVVGDGNGDGIADILQTDVSSLPWAQTPDGTTRFVTLTNGSGLSQLGVKPLEIAPGQLPADLKLPLGLLAFKVDKVPESGRVDFTVYLDSDIPVNGYWKEIDGEWVNIASSITTEGGKTRITFTIEDGGRFDADGVKNGTIVDPGAPGWRTQTNPDADGDQFPDALEADNGLVVGVKDNDVFASTKLFVMQLYRDFLYREAEPEGLAYWQARLDSGELTREDVAHTFLFASEFQDNAGAVARLYLGTYDRIADNEGMQYWVDAMQEGQSLTQVAEQVAASDEFAELYGSLDDDGFVRELYLNVQGRDADAAGSAWWVGQLEAGMSRGEVLVRFTQSDEYVAQSQQEVAVTLSYVGLLNRTPEQAGFDYWLHEIEAGRSELEVIGQFLGTEEYHDRFLPAGQGGGLDLVGQTASVDSEINS